MNSSWADVEAEVNKMILSTLKHRALNSLVNDNQEPQKQLEVFYDMRKPVLSTYTQEIFETLIAMERVDFYDKNIIKKRK